MNPNSHEPSAETSVTANAGAFDIGLHRVALAAPLRWLQLGWRDFMRAPVIGVFYGTSFAAMGWTLLLLFRHAPAYTLALSAGFLLVGPFLCLGLYDVSRRLERGATPRLATSLVAWRARTGTMAVFGAVLLILEMLWARASLVVFALSFDGMPDFKGSMLALLDPENLAFIVAYLAVGGLFAGIIFAISVVAMPMILDRQTDAITAGLTSLRLCLTQPAVMLCWGAVITLLVVLAMLPGFAGLLVAAPVLGHASWHAYRATVAAPP
jgi:uncharacterized membrane protein